METTENNSETWQVDAGGRVYDAPFEELAEWIAEGAVVRIDRVRKGNLRWIEAGKVPALADFFNAKDLKTASEPIVTTSSGMRSNVEVLGPRSDERPVFEPRITNSTASTASTDLPEMRGACSVHSDLSAAFVCDTCASAFCKTCPSSYGGTVKICPFCGAMCNPVAKAEQSKVVSQIWERAATEKFGAGDFFIAVAYPFKYPLSLIFGAVMFAFFSLGQGAASFGGAFMLAAAMMCFMCANMLSFGVLAHVVESFSQGKIGGNFMPSFDDFNIWDDVVHPFFLMIGVYVSSFGPLAAVLVVSMFLIAGAVKPSADGIDPTVAAAPGQIQQGANIKQLIAQQNGEEQNRIDTMTDANKLAQSQTANAAPEAAEEQHFQNLNDQINQARKSQLESAIGKAPETKAAEQKAMFAKFLGYGAIFLICSGLALLWGLFYLPAACCVAGYTRSFGATVNPTVGLDTIKRLGVDYAKLLLMGLVIAVMSIMISSVLSLIFSAFTLPGVGNLPANFIGSLIGFYLSVVFSITLGLVIFKASGRLQLFKA